MSSKMRAGLIAGGFGMALYIAMLLSVLLSPDLSFLLYLTLPLVLGVLAGLLAALWLDVSDYGRQFPAGGFAGFIAAVMVGVCDALLRLVLATIDKPNPTNALFQTLISSIPISSSTLLIAIMVIVNLLIYLVYIATVFCLGGLMARMIGHAKSVEALQAMLEAQEARMAPPELEGEAIDLSLARYERPEYSPFVSEPPLTLSPWQRRRLEREGKLIDEGGASGEVGIPEPRQQRPVRRVSPPRNWQGPKPR